MRNQFLSRCLTLLMALCLIVPAAVAEDSFTVTFYEENSEESTVLSTQTVAKGEKAELPEEPVREGYTFLGWFGTPTYRFEFDFETPIEADTAVFARWQAPFTPDERVWYLTGSMNGWDAADQETYLMQRQEDANIFTIVVELQANNEFQINTGGTWDNQRGAGYLKETTPADAISGGGGLSDSAFKSNMKATVDGEYEIVFNSDLDEIVITRLGDMQGEVEVAAVTPMIVGTVNNYTFAEDPADSPFALKEEDGLYALNINLNAGDEFSVTRFNDWSVPYRTVNVDMEASDAPLAETSNISVTERGRYRITLDADTETVVVTKLGDYEVPEGEPVITFINGDAESTITVRSGARIPRPAKPEQDGMLYIGWFTPEDALFPFNERTVDGDITLTAKFMGPDDVDTRSYHVYGSITGWAMDDTTYTLEKEADANVYGITMDLKAGDQFQLLEGAHSENQVSSFALEEGGYDPEKIGGAGNVEVKADGTYTITFNSFTRALRVEAAE